MVANVYPLPRDGESLSSYVRLLAQRNAGYTSVEQFKLDWWGDRNIAPMDLSYRDFEKVLGPRPKHLGKLTLLSTKRKSKSHMYRHLSIPSHQLHKSEMYCPNCFSEQGYMLSKWQIGWLPMCLKHERPLIPVCDEMIKRLFVGEKPGLPKEDRRHYDLFGHGDVCEIQQKLEKRLENEANGLAFGSSVIEVVDQQLIASLGLKSKDQLLLRRRRYAMRHYPLKGTESVKFLDCIANQSLAA